MSTIDDLNGTLTEHSSIRLSEIKVGDVVECIKIDIANRDFLTVGNKYVVISYVVISFYIGTIDVYADDGALFTDLTRFFKKL